MKIKRLLLLAALAVLPCTSAVAISMGYPDYVHINLQRFRDAEQWQPVNTNDTVASWATLCDVLRKEERKSRSDAQTMSLRKLNKTICISRIFVLPILLLFILVHTRSFIRSTRPGSWGLLVVLIIVWFLAGNAYMWDEGGLTYPAVGFLLALIIIVSRDYVRVGPGITWLGMLVMAVLFFCPIAGWVVPKGFSYLEDYDFPEYSPRSASTNQIVVCEKLDIRPHRLWKAALFVDGRMTGLKSEELVMLLQEQKKELTVFKAIDSE